MALLQIECLANPMKETKLAADGKVKSERLLHISESPKAKHETSNGICLNEDYSKEGWKRQNKVNMIGEDEALIRLKKLRPVLPPTPMPIIPLKDDDDEDEKEGGDQSQLQCFIRCQLTPDSFARNIELRKSFQGSFDLFWRQFPPVFSINIKVIEYAFSHNFNHKLISSSWKDFFPWKGADGDSSE